jgi:hypothetical protein
MPVPDDVIFGPAEGGGASNYGQIRAMSESDRRKALKRRLDSWLIDQTSELLFDKSGERKVYAPFPLVVMSCIAIESLGQIFFGARNRNSEGVQKDCFVAIAKQIDQKFSRQLTLEFKEKLSRRWPGKDFAECNNFADLLYKFFRNTLIHSYQGYGVYITEDDTPSCIESNGFIVINPNWLWNSVCKCYSKLWKELDKAQDNNPRKISCNAYLNRILSLELETDLETNL